MSFLDTAKNGISDRFKDSLLGPFSTFFLTWNYPIVLYALTGTSQSYQRIEMIQIYLRVHSPISTFGAPALAAIIYFSFWPWFLRQANKITRMHERKKQHEESSHEQDLEFIKKYYIRQTELFSLLKRDLEKYKHTFHILRSGLNELHKSRLYSQDLTAHQITHRLNDMAEDKIDNQVNDIEKTLEAMASIQTYNQLLSGTKSTSEFLEQQRQIYRKTLK